ncbi:MAG: hypothetical protein N3A57_05745, partial [Negativicutes bacterium]|nr:hypothetical protein [Negativicutes bacterium]
ICASRLAAWSAVRVEQTAPRRRAVLAQPGGSSRSSRSAKRLRRALSDINYLRHRIEQFYSTAVINRNIIELRNAVIAAECIVRAALANPASCGCHYIGD